VEKNALEVATLNKIPLPEDDYDNEIIFLNRDSQFLNWDIIKAEAEVRKPGTRWSGDLLR
jgi:hypothetical protein